MVWREGKRTSPWVSWQVGCRNLSEDFIPMALVPRHIMFFMTSH